MHRRSFLASTLSTSLPLVALTPLLAGESESSSSREATLEQELAGSSRGPWRRLFLDSTTVETQHGLQRVFHSPEKHEANPILVADRPWEGTSAIIGPYVYGTVFREGSRWRMWYQLLCQGNHIGYAESNDGVVWKKPELPYIAYQNLHRTNLVVSAYDPDKSNGGQCHNPSVVQLIGETNPSRRYALYGFDGNQGHPRVAYSQDGLKWTYDASSDSDGLFSSSDVVHFFYDPYHSRYASTWKTRNRRGRAVGVATSTNGTAWVKSLDGPVFGADDHDPDATQVYGMPVFPYQGLYIGLPWVYHARYFRYGDYSVDKLHEAQSDSPRTIEPQLAWSWDLVSWNRPHPREPFLRRGEPGTWDSGMIVTARAPVEYDGKLFFCYGGTDKVHDEKRAQAGIGLATMRSDGFCSMQTLAADDESWFISRREAMLGPSLLINAKTTDDGYVMAEILDRHNRVVDGFSRQECQKFQGDSVAHRVQWKRARFPNSEQTDYKIRFHLKNAEIFSYFPEELDPTQPDLARVPTAGP